MIICYFGDSLTLGYGDESGLGWPGRITRTGAAHGLNMTAYNLGVRKDITLRLQSRWMHEAALRAMDNVPGKLVFSFGVADVMNAVPLEDSLAAAADILTKAPTVGETLVIGPTPVIDPDKNNDIRILSAEIAALCESRKIPFIPTFDSMESSAVYRQALSDGDTVHPVATGYATLAEHILHDKTARTFFGLG